MDKMDHNAHSVYLMYYHLIMVVKYRRKVIDDPISERASVTTLYCINSTGLFMKSGSRKVNIVLKAPLALKCI